ncbi:6-pyruvoyl trahydropterin synthase family protein [Catellatospora citrea]|uniref:6-carboxy-5,6,7,8-tetrahydropterin synthase n=1 Tax=Catellatospora citrea TaxID=53366 RepID=A0A8J3KJK9_9ACTN|nr:6-pyruvoyl tetrahydropterin synthase family protein [Catellatospora citrea]RKE07900.1 6-pyruvoyltetrahydropterin/6-carboxytetrahydropterin synthase [Catellatospora citrea]GIG02090.1 6-carboxy-5,6,7,8-tetrahydropterin synthase [Catellatospora citrea]
MFTISKTFRFEASHRLAGLPEGHKCARLHGHSYAVTVELDADYLDPPGFVMDFAQLSPLGDYLKIAFDHQHLNDVLTVQPTSENLARLFTEWCVGHLPLAESVSAVTVRVSETTSSWAQYRWRRP